MRPVERVPICNQVVEGIQSLIRERDLQVGDKLPTERELCEAFAVGRSTIREAMRALEAMGALTLKQGRGAFVGAGFYSDRVAQSISWYGSDDIRIRDFVEIRLAIEPLCTKLAIERASAEEIAEIARILSLFIQAAPKKDPLLLAKYDELFHLEIAKATHNKLMVSIQEAIRKEVFELRVRSFSVPERMEGAIAPHEKILKAFYSRDSGAGAEAMAEHLQEAFEEVLATEQYPEDLPRPDNSQGAEL